MTCQLIFVWLEIGSWTCLVWILSVSDFIGIGNWRNFSWRQNLVSKKICLLKETLLDDLRPWQSLYLPSRCYILDSITYFIHFLILHKKNEHFLFQIILMMNTPFIPIILVPKQQKKKTSQWPNKFMILTVFINLNFLHLSIYPCTTYTDKNTTKHEEQERKKNDPLMYTTLIK